MIRHTVASVAMMAVLGGATTSSLMGMELKNETLTTSKVYKTTRSAVTKTLDKMGVKYNIDKDGDIHFRFGKGNYKGLILFNESSGRIWNLQVVSTFGMKKSHYDEALAYVNKWNQEKRIPKLSMWEKDKLLSEYNYPVQYGFNPDEFETNVYNLYVTAMKQILDEIDAMRE